MQRNTLRLLTPYSLRWLLLALVLSTVTGCSVARFGYNQAHHVAYWWLDGYVDFNDTQKPRTREAITQWFSWHRREQLPDYAQLLTRAQNFVREDITAERTCGLWTEIRGYVDSAFERALPITAEITVTLTPRQIENIERRYAKVNAEFRDEHLKGDASKRLKKSIKRTAERAEFFYGKLDSAQQEFIAQGVTRSPYEVDLWNTERERRQQDILRVLRQLNADGSGHDKAEGALRAYMERMYRSPSNDYRAYADQLWVYNCAFVAGLHNTTTAEQRNHAAKKLKGWESDIRVLVPSTETAGLDPSSP